MGNWGRVNIGSGGGKLFAIIAVTYPAGSVCTCTNGTRILKAKDTSGKVLFNVPSTGTWTVSCTNGTESTGNSVTITSETQAKIIELTYSLKIFASNSGMAEEFTGSVNTSGSYSITNEKLSITKSGNYADAQIHKIAKVDLTAVKTLVFDAIVSAVFGGNYSTRIGCWSAVPNFNNGGSANVVAAIQLTADKVRKEYTVDVSSVSGEYYIGLAGNGTVDVYNITGRYD